MIKYLLALLRSMFGVPPKYPLHHGGEVYDARYYRVDHLGDLEPWDMGPGYVWQPDAVLLKKEWWEPTYGLPYAKVSDMPPEMQKKVSKR